MKVWASGLSLARVSLFLSGVKSLLEKMLLFLVRSLRVALTKVAVLLRWMEVGGGYLLGLRVMFFWTAFSIFLRYDSWSLLSW